MRLNRNLIVRALRNEIARIDQAIKTDHSFEASWDKLQLEKELELLTGPTPTAETFLQKVGGEWLGYAHEWIQRKAMNGSDVTWGSNEYLQFSSHPTVSDIERLAANCAVLGIQQYLGTYVKRVQRPLNHYDWLDANFTAFLAKAFERDSLKRKAEDAAEFLGMVSAHGDKCYSYRSAFENAGVPFEHGVAVYLLSYIPPWSATVRQTGNGWVEPKEWVIKKYPEFKELMAPAHQPGAHIEL